MKSYLPSFSASCPTSIALMKMPKLLSPEWMLRPPTILIPNPCRVPARLIVKALCFLVSGVARVDTSSLKIMK